MEGLEREERFFFFFFCEGIFVRKIKRKKKDATKSLGSRRKVNVNGFCKVVRKF